MLILNLPMQPSCLVHLSCSLGEQDIHAGKQRLHLLEGDEGDRSSKIAFGLFFFSAYNGRDTKLTGVRCGWSRLPRAQAAEVDLDAVAGAALLLLPFSAILSGTKPFLCLGTARLLPAPAWGRGVTSCFQLCEEKALSGPVSSGEEPQGLWWPLCSMLVQPALLLGLEVFKYPIVLGRWQLTRNGSQLHLCNGRRLFWEEFKVYSSLCRDKGLKNSTNASPATG